MNDDRIKGKVDEIKGDVKQRIGGATKDRSLEGEGVVDEAKGKLRQGIGTVKEKVKEAFEKKRDRKDPDPDRDV